MGKLTGQCSRCAVRRAEGLASPCQRLVGHTHRGSVASIKGFPSFSVYDATKAAVRSFARGWILDLKGRDIRINVLSPGHIDTPGLSELMTDAQKTEVVSHVPLGRLGTPDDMAKVAVFLASDDSAYVNGIELFADGGVAQY